MESENQSLELSDADFDRLLDDPDAVWSLVKAVDERMSAGAEGRFQRAMSPFRWVFDCRCSKRARPNGRSLSTNA